ncbi:MAG TPA: LptF/LptG family permease [Gemmatimonadaceae bacterium]|nr:LptF/LptG family permease [Gemmatimonadaceae bacterium]
MRRHLFRPLDRYVAGEFWKIFIATALGFPLLVIVIDLVDNLDKYLNRNLSNGQIAMAYLYWIPDSMFMALPAAVLFATVFTIGGLTRHSEVTAAKASGISFHRMVMPIFASSVIVTLLALVISEIVPVTNARRAELLKEREHDINSDRYNFAYASESGRVYKVAALSRERAVLENLEVERRGTGPEYPTLLLVARTAAWDSTRHRWTLRRGELHVIPDSISNVTISYDSLHDNAMRERPEELLAQPHSPQEMRYRELGRYIGAMERSGADVNELKVEQALKIAIPVTCIIIAIFGAPLATSTQRGGAAYGIGVSLATTIIFLMLIQITKAVGGGGILPPVLAAWIPNAAFGAAGLLLLSRTRT